MIVLPDRGRPIAYDLRGSATNVDLRRLPKSVRAPQLDTLLSLADYHVKGSGGALSGSATFNQSQVEGATIAAGTVVEVDTVAQPLSYAARGTVHGMDVRRLGKALDIGALDDDRYDGQVNGAFDLRASGTSLDELTLSASGTLTDSSMWGTHVPEMTFKTDIAGGALTVAAKGAFDQLNPAVITDRDSLVGNVNGTVDATLHLADLQAPVTPATIEVDGRVTLAPSLVGSVQIAAADVEGRYAGEIADITRLHVDGPDVKLDASGRLALGRTATSDLKYHINAPDITEVGRIAGQEGLEGAVDLDGTVTGNAASLQTSGTLSGNGLAYGNNKILDRRRQIRRLGRRSGLRECPGSGDEPRRSFVELGGTQINQLTATTTYAQKRLEFETRAQERGRALAATGSVMFHPDHHEIHLPRLALTAQGIEWRNVEGSEAAIQYGQNQLTIKDLRLTSGDQALDVEGTLSPAGAKTAGVLEVHARNVDLAQVEALLLQNRGLSGRLTTDATISGSFDRPSIDGKVEVTGGGFQSYTYQSLVADVDYAGDRITLDATLQQAPGVAITARGTLPTSAFQKGADEHVAGTPEDAIDLRLQTAALNLGVIQGFTTAVSAVGGTLHADVRVTGSGRDPHLEGFVEIRDGAFAVPRFGTSYSGLDTRIDLEPDVVRVRRFEILDENGEQLAVAGELAVHARQIGAVNFTLDSENFEVIDNDLGDVGVGTRLKITGRAHAAQTRRRHPGDGRPARGQPHPAVVL